MNTLKYIALSGFAFSLSAKADQQLIIGGTEQVSFAGTVLSAKIDTGADHSSLHAVNPERYTKNGEPWVRFTLLSADGTKTTIEKKIIRFAKIKQTNYHGTEKRMVIHLELCLGTVRQIAEVSLVDRSKHSQPMLIGRSFLKDKFLVDASKRYRVAPQCGESLE